MDFAKLELGLFDREPGAREVFFEGYRSIRSEPWPEEEARTEIAVALELLGQIPYFKRNDARSELAETLARVRSWLY